MTVCGILQRHFLRVKTDKLKECVDKEMSMTEAKQKLEVSDELFVELLYYAYASTITPTK